MPPRVQTSPFRADTLRGRVAVVTGGGSGIGYEIVRQLGLHGAKVAIMGRREGPLKAAIEALTVEGVDALAVPGDVRLPEDCAKLVEQAVRRFGKVNILVNNAAGNFLSPAEDLQPKGFKTVLEIDTMGVFNMCHAAFPELKKAGEALIVHAWLCLRSEACGSRGPHRSTSARRCTIARRGTRSTPRPPRPRSTA
eukprot:Unigene9374_Nuclearia_a/m.28613 Unigene9374_Nuclearia_a/g.28613  ORF Unigene9374_Nuclearia_a/g.28613 Unigene9374_Nuclearia_a/m.28613 type:complete len:195 (+) Unigene9374_Nuclearia_a:25-609(+)